MKSLRLYGVIFFLFVGILGLAPSVFGHVLNCNHIVQLDQKVLNSPDDGEINLRNLISSETVISRVSGFPVFEVVYTENNPNMPKGIYKRTPDGWEAAILGTVMKDSTGVPIIHQLELSRLNDQGLILAVVDGRFILLNRESNASNPDSYINLGSAQNPLLEIGSEQKRYLTEVQDSKNFNVYQDVVFTQRSTQVLAISLRFVSLQTVGEGMTFFLEVSPQNGLIRLEQAPLVIDYKFHSTQELSGLFSGAKAKIIRSEILVDQIRKRNLSHFGSHSQQLRENINQSITSDSKKQSHTLTEPLEIYYDLNNRTAHYTKEYKRIIDQRLYDLVQYYNIETGQSWLEIKGSKVRVSIPGKLDFLSSGKLAYWIDESKTVFLLSIDGNLHLVIIKFEDITKVEIGPSIVFFSKFLTSSWPEEMNFKYFVVHNETQSKVDSGKESEMETVEKGYLFFTGKYQEEGFTAALMLRKLKNSYVLIPYNPFVLLHHYVSSKELEARIENRNSRIYVDVLTPKVRSVEAYQEARSDARPKLDLIATYDQGLKKKVFAYKGPLQTRELFPQIYYVNFAAYSEVEDPSGIYYGVNPRSVTGGEDRRIGGEILIREMKNQTRSPSENNFPENKYLNLESHNFFLSFLPAAVVTNEDGKEVQPIGSTNLVRKNFYAYLFANDPSENGGKNGYQLSLIIHDPGGNTIKKARVLVPPQAPASFSQLETTFFVQGGLIDSNFIYLFLSFQGDQSSGKGITFYTRINLFDFSEKQIIPTFVDDRYIPPELISDRFSIDEFGVPVLNLSPELTLEAPNLVIFDSKLGKKEYPNSATSSNQQRRILPFGGRNVFASSFEGYLGRSESWSLQYFDLRANLPQLGQSVELSQFENFIELGKELDSMSDLDHPAKRMILVVPQKLQALVWDFIISRAVNRNSSRGSIELSRGNLGFSMFNDQLIISVFDPAKGSQEKYFSNMAYWKTQKRRSFLVAKTSDLLLNNGGKPEPNDPLNAFQITNVRSTSSKSEEVSFDIKGKEEKITPSFLYLLAAEGKMPISDFKSNVRLPQFSSLILATPEEMKAIEKKADSEIENGLLDWFDIKEIKDPNEDSMARSLASIFENPEVKWLRFQFSASEIKQRAQLSETEHFETVIEYAVSRFSHLANQKNSSKLESFMRFRAAFAEGVLSDRELRRSRVIDKYFIERVLTQVFDIPSNLAIFPEDDPLKILSRPDALVKFQEAGYSGNYETKQKVRDVILSQTAVATGRTIPSSTIFFGKSGSGKTSFFQALIKLLNLKIYDFSDPSNNDGANCIIVNVGKLVDQSGRKSESGNEQMSVGDAIEHLNNFLSLPQGHRGFIFIDDFSAGHGAIKSNLIEWIRSLFEAKDGLYLVSMGKSVVRRPIRNINLFLALNPVPSKGNNSRSNLYENKNTIEEALLESLSTDEHRVETSFLRRFGLILSWDHMPFSAKGPELIRTLGSSSNDLLGSSERFFLVSPHVIKGVVEAHEMADARSFLSGASSGFLQKIERGSRRGTFGFVIPSDGEGDSRRADKSVFELTPSEKIIRWIEANTRILTVDGGLEGKLFLVRMILDAFRIPIYEYLVNALQGDSRFSLDLSQESGLLEPVLLAIHDHLKLKPFITLSDLNLLAYDFGLTTSGERTVFRNMVARANSFSKDSGLNFQIPSSTLKAMVRKVDHYEGKVTLRILFSETFLKSKSILENQLKKVLGVNSLDPLISVSDWMKEGEQRLDKDVTNSRRAYTHNFGEEGVKPSSIEIQQKQSTKQLVDNLWLFLRQSFDQRLLQNSRRTQHLSIYGATRNYLMLLDRAIEELPWAQVSIFLNEVVNNVISDQVLSQKPWIQRFLFGEPLRLLKSSIPDLVFQMIDSNQNFQTLDEKNKERLKLQFEQDFMGDFGEEIK